MKLAAAGLLFAAAVVLTGTAAAAKPSDRVGTPRPTPTPAWPCYGPGWQPGDVWGPGPDDVVPDVPPCPVPTEAVPLRPNLTPPPTDT